MNNSRTFVFFSKYLGQSGSEHLLKLLVNDLAEKPEFNIVVVGYSDGTGHLELNKNISFFSFIDFRRKRNSFLRRQLRRYISQNKSDIEIEFLNLIHHKFPSAVWILNTLAMVSPMDFIEKKAIRSLVWIHEMDVCYYWLNTGQLELFRRVFNQYICVSEAVASFVRNLNPEGTIRVIYPGIKIKSILPEALGPENSKMPGSPLVIGMSGGIDVNKNPVFLLKFAEYLQRKDEKRFKIVWVGGDQNNGMFSYLNYAIKSGNLENIIEFTGHKKEGYLDFIRKFDIFLLTSYVDSFPLVMLEAASYGIPVLGYESGGVTEFVNDSKIGEILPDRSFETLYQFLSDWAMGKKVFNKVNIFQRSQEFSFERFSSEFQKLLV